MKFDFNNRNLRYQYENIAWIEESGVDASTLSSMFSSLMEENKDENHAVLKAKTFKMICESSRIAIDKDDIFQEKLFAADLINYQRWELWHREIAEGVLNEKFRETREAWDVGAYRADPDFGHTSANTKPLLEVGFSGLLNRVNEASMRGGLTKKQKDFYLSCKIVLEASISFCLRLADAVAPYNRENEAALRSIASGEPKNSYEAMQLLIVYFFLHEYVFKTRVRTLGRLDVLLYPFVKKDIENGRYTMEEIKEMILFFLNKFSTANVAYGLPFCLGGMDENEEDVTNELSYLIVEAYRSLDVISPKIHIRVSNKTPKDFIKLVLSCIRSGQSSFVFCNDDVTIRSLMSVGVSLEDARDYTPIGCYEPAVWGKEIGCTGNSGVSLAKAVELVLSGGVDTKSNKAIGVPCDPSSLVTFEDFCSAVKEQIAFMANKCIDYVCEIEKYYDFIGPDPIHSCMYEDSVLRGVDVYEGGAKYNNSSLYFYFIASFVDSLCAIKRFVYDEKRLTLSELFEILKQNWAGNEKLRLLAKKIPEKYGNGNEVADAISVEFSDYCASLTNNRPNARGGVFKASLFSIDRCYFIGKKMMATPDGRLEGEPLSKNLGASFGMDKNGILALISSATKMDHSKFPNGSVLDVTLHPSAVAGEDGLEAFYGLLKTYFIKGGYAMHGNVFNLDDLYAAQEDPERYKTLQVRLCGWNAYFVDLSKEEQDSLIKQTEVSI